MGRRSRKRGPERTSGDGSNRAARDAARRERARGAEAAGLGHNGDHGGGSRGRDPGDGRGAGGGGRGPGGGRGTGGGGRPAVGSRPGGDRPEPLWGAFPLTELVTLAGIVLMVWGFLSGAGSSGNRKIAAGLAIASIAGLELAIREHLTGFHSHTTLLSGAAAILTILVLGLGAGIETLGIILLAALSAFVATFIALRELFKRRSGGLTFR